MFVYFLSGCENSTLEITPEEMGYYFFPLERGIYRDYKVHRIEYSVLGNHDTLDYFLKEQVADSFLNQAGGISYKLERYTKTSDTLTWQLDSVWTVTKSTTNVVVVENNVPFVKLVFPVKEQKKWDGNAFNVRSEELYTYEYTFQPIVIGERNYNSTLKVIHQDNPDNIVMTDIRNEIYAENIGLIYKESIILHYCTDNECLGDLIIEQGINYKQELIEHGKE